MLQLIYITHNTAFLDVIAQSERCGSSVFGDVVQWIRCLQVSWFQVQVSAFPKLGLVAQYCNTATGGNEHQGATGLHGLISLFWSVV
jgi:hypothetical protein